LCRAVAGTWVPTDRKDPEMDTVDPTSSPDPQPDFDDDPGLEPDPEHDPDRDDTEPE
jgi:hypothetical protein